MKQEFWRDWKRKTKLEENAIKTLKASKKLILNKIPKSKINSIYVKGSFIRREMNKKSDVDMVVIINDNKYLKKVEKLAKDYTKSFKPEVGISVMSLWEIEKNKHFYKSNKPKSKPYLFLKKVDKYKLIYGKKIDPKRYPQKEIKDLLQRRVRTFRDTFIPLYHRKKKEIGFSGLIKQVFWLVELDEEFKREKAAHTWKKLNKSIKNKTHIIHLAYKYRLNKPKDKRLRDAFVKKLEKYLDKLEKNLR